MYCRHFSIETNRLLAGAWFRQIALASLGPCLLLQSGNIWPGFLTKFNKSQDFSAHSGWTCNALTHNLPFNMVWNIFPHVQDLLQGVAIFFKTGQFWKSEIFCLNYVKLRKMKVENSLSICLSFDENRLLKKSWKKRLARAILIHGIFHLSHVFNIFVSR